MEELKGTKEVFTESSERCYRGNEDNLKIGGSD